MAWERNMPSKERILLILSVIVGLSLVGMITAWVAIPGLGVLGESFHDYSRDGLRYAGEPSPFGVKVGVPYLLVARTRGILSILLGILVVASTFLPSTSSGPEFFIDFPRKIVIALLWLYGGGTAIWLMALILVPETDIACQGLPSLLEVAISRSIFSYTVPWLLICLAQFLVSFQKFRKIGNQRIRLNKEIESKAEI